MAKLYLGTREVTPAIFTSGIGIPREAKNGVYQMPTENFTFSLPSEATNVGYYGFAMAFFHCTSLTSIDLSSLTTLSNTGSFYSACESCISLTSIDLSSLTTVSGSNCFDNAFRDCPRLTSVNLSSLATVSGNRCFNNAFRNCTSLTSVNLSSLTTVSGNSCFDNAFYGCTALTDIYFRALTTSSFGSYVNQFNNIMQSTGTNVTHTLHFPSNMESTIQGLTGYPLFGGTSGYVVLSFDLPATS